METAGLSLWQKCIKFINDPVFGWIPLFIVLMTLGGMSAATKQIPVEAVFLVGLMAIGLESSWYLEQGPVTFTDRVLIGFHDALKFGALLAIAHVSNEHSLLVSPVKIAIYALTFGGLVGLITAFSYKPPSPSFNALYIPGTALEQGGAKAFIIYAWPVIGWIGGLGLLFFIQNPIWAALFVALNLCFAPGYRAPLGNARSGHVARVILTLRNLIIGIFSLGIALITWGIIIP